MQESGEMYLENLLILREKRPNVKAVDLAEQMGFSKPSVSRALAKLKESGYITIDGSGFILLTEYGEGLAAKIYERHQVIRGMLMALGVSQETASRDACRIEHVISDESFDALKAHVGSNTPGKVSKES